MTKIINEVYNNNETDLIRKAMDYYDLHSVELNKFQNKINSCVINGNIITLYDVEKNVLYDGAFQTIIIIYRNDIYYNYMWSWNIYHDKRTLYYAKQLLLYAIDLNIEDDVTRQLLTTSMSTIKIPFLCVEVILALIYYLLKQQHFYHVDECIDDEIITHHIYLTDKMKK